jgi:CubicO group peptidase (beta-lactamase class C family)
MPTPSEKRESISPDICPPQLPGGMAFPAKEWEESTPAAQGMDGAGLERALSHLARHCGEDGIAEIAVVRNGFLIRKGERSGLSHNVWSCTKSFTGTVLGLLIDRGKCSLDSPAADFLPSLEEEYSDVTLRHFATMTSGYDGGGDQSRNPFAPARPLSPRGAEFRYWDSAMNQFAHLLTRIAGEPIEDLFRRCIADPLGIDPGAWKWGDFGTFGGLRINGGSGNQGKGIHISALDLARFGHLFLNQGLWEGRQLLSPSWTEQATKPQVPASIPAAVGKSAEGPGSYGFAWWTNGVRIDGTRRWPDAPPGAYAALGFNNNRCFVVPEWNLVLVRLGRDGNIDEEVYNTFFRLLAQALR